MTKTKMNMLLATTAVFALSGCLSVDTPSLDRALDMIERESRTQETVSSDSSGGSSSVSTPVLPEGSFALLENEGLSLVNDFSNATPTLIMPAGSATFEGIAAYSGSHTEFDDIIAFAEVLSEIELTANFGSDEINGRAFNFQDFDPLYTYDGEVAISGEIVGSELAGVVSGTLTETFNNKSNDVFYSGNISGNFVGNNADAIVGEGQVKGEGSWWGDTTINSVFGARKQ